MKSLFALIALTLAFVTLARGAVTEGKTVRYQQTGNGLSYAVSEVSEFVREITLRGVLDHGVNIEYFGVTEDDLGTPFVLRMRYDTRAEEEEETQDDPTRASYDSPYPTTLDFGNWHFSSPDSEIRVYARWDNPDDLSLVRISGFTFGSGSPFVQNGLSFPDYNGLYVNFAGPFDPTVTPDDSLHWIESQGGNPQLSATGYVKLEGTVVPEPSPLALWLAAALLWRRRTSI